MTDGSPVTLYGLIIRGGRASHDDAIRVESTPFTSVNSTVRSNEAGVGGIAINNTLAGS